MESLVAIGNSIVGKIAEYTVEPIGRQFGYLFYYQSNMNNLRTQFENLKDFKKDLEHSLEEPRRRGEEITDGVKTWLRKADNISEMVESFLRDEGQANTGCSTKSFPNLVLRHQLSRRAKKMAQSVVEIKEEARTFDKVSYVPILQNILETEGYTGFETRNSILKGIMEALGNNDIRKIGIYGMPGVGKTTLAKQVAERALQAKLFTDAVDVAVSASPKLEKIQQDIADRLGLVFHEEGVKARAVRLRQRLKTEKNLLIVLDDVWKKLDLLDIGVCFEDEQKGCKILLTSRYRGVLEDDMGVDKNFEVELLSDSEAWSWFSKIVGESNDLLSEHFATEIVKECARLPLAIITVAHSLKNKGIHYWKDALSRLQRSSMDEKVYLSVKLSYDYLADREERSVLLFCSLREEDEEISFDDLLNWCIGWDLFKDIYTLEEARNRLQRLLDELKSRCLLLKGNYRGEYSVKMHDVIRDVGISIAASKDFKMYNIRSNDELKKYLDNINELKDSIAISLGANYEDECLPSRLNCPELLLLSMGRESSRRKGSSLPDNFFEETKKLRVLNLSSLRLKPLPSSFCCLENLQALHLVEVEIGEIHLIGELKKLKVLDLRRSRLEQLPEQIGQLTCLRKLDLFGCTIEVVPPNVISRLVNLEELNMVFSFSNWKAEGVDVDDENRSRASLREVKNLTKLTALYLEIPHANMLPKDLFSTKLERYYIKLGDGAYILTDFRTVLLQLNLEFDTSSLLKERGFQMLLKRSESLDITRFNGLKSIVSELDQEGGFKHLKALVVIHNDEIQYVIDYSSMEPNHISDHGVLPSLETFEFRNVQSLEKICRGELRGTKPLGKLREANVSMCNKLKNLLPFSIANKLEKIIVYECCMMEEIVTFERRDVINSEAVDRIEFPNLKKMLLFDLPQLTRFCSECDTSSGTPDQGQESEQQLYHSDSPSTLFNQKSQGQGSEQLLFADSASTFFNQKVAFPSLESLKLHELNSNKRIWPNQLPETSKLHNLRDLSVWYCKRLKYALPCAIAESLVQLKKLSVGECEEMEEIIMIKEPKDAEKIDQKLLPNLQSVELIDLPNLARLCSIETNNICGLNFVPEVRIRNCSKLWSRSAEKKEDKDMNLQEKDKNSMPSPCDEKQVEFSAGLDKSSLSSVQRIPYDPLVPNFTTKLELYNCDNVENLLSASMAKSFVHLRTLDVTDCKLLKEVVVTEESGDGIRSQKIYFPALKHLKLSCLPNLEKFCAGDHIEWLFLEMLQIESCPKLSTFISDSIDEAVSEETDMDSVATQPALFNNQKVKLPKLRILTLEKCNSVIEIWHDTKDRGQQSAAAGRSSSAFQSLECLLVFDCGSLNKLESNSSVIFESMTVVEVVKCDRMEYLFTPSAAKTLVLLKKMCVSECQAMKEIIASSSSLEANHDDKLLIASFHNLELLMLDSLPSLTSFHMANCALEFPKLSRVVVSRNCPELRSFCGHGTITTPKLRTFVRRKTQMYNPLQTWFEDTGSQIIIHHDRADNTGDKIELQEEEGGNIDINTTIQQFWENYHAQK